MMLITYLPVHLLYLNAMNREEIIHWLMEGDVSLQFQTSRDLLGVKEKKLQSLQRKIALEGWGLRFLKKQNVKGHWGISSYQPKWTSTHYTLLDLKNIGLHRNNVQAAKAIELVLNEPLGNNGGINIARSLKNSDVCINGMILNYAAYFLPNHPRLRLIVDFLLDVQMADGGWNCQYLKEHTTHSSLHSTLSVLEGLYEFRRSAGRYRLSEILDAEKEAVEFLLNHHLYQSHRTGRTIDVRMLRLSFPCRWRYDILRCLDYFQDANVPYDPRMEDGLNIIRSKRKKDGTWPLQERHKGEVHFDMEKIGAPSRWNTLRAMRVLDYFNK
jgi:hypothetical protein